MIPPIKVITETVECLRTLAAIVLAIVPKWETHIWYSTLRERATHSFVLPVGDQLWTECEDREWSVVHIAFIVDFRFEKREGEIYNLSLDFEREKPPTHA